MTDEAERAGAGGPRWDPDDRGIGVGDARAHLDHLDRLRDAADTDGWVAEDPAAHLLPYLERAVPAGSGWAIDATTDHDGAFVVDLRWTGEVGPDRQTVRAAAYALIGSVAGVASTTSSGVMPLRLRRSARETGQRSRRAARQPAP